MFNWKLKATNAIFLEDDNGQEGRPFKARFLQAGLVKYDFGVCLLKKETIDKFVNTFVGNPVIINHKDLLTEADRVGTINKIWFSAEDGWFWCEGVITDNTAIELIEKGYNVSCQYRITDYVDNTEGKLHNANPYDKEILNGVFEHLAIVENPRYEDAFIAVNAYIAANNEFKEDEHPRDDEGKFTDGGNDKNFTEKAKQIKPIEISGKDIPKFENKKELSNWMKAQFEQLGSVKINDSGIDLKLSAGKANREAIKRRSTKEENKAVVTKFKEIVSQAIKKDKRKADERHNKDQEIYYNKFQIDGKDYEVEIFVDMPYGSDKNSYYAGHSATKIEIAPRDTMNVSNDLTHYAKSATFSIPYLVIDFNPASTITVSNSTTKYQKVFEWLQTTKGESMDNETKGLFSALVEAIKARNEAEDEKDKKEAEKSSNEDVDKRKLIDEIGGILKGKVDEELWRTIIGKAEKIAYDKSEAGTADNSKAKNADEEDEKDKEKCKEAANKCKNEEDDKNYEKLYKELKEKVEKEVEEEKEETAKNSLDDAVNILYSALTPEPKDLYISTEKGLELGKQIYG